MTSPVTQLDHIRANLFAQLAAIGAAIDAAQVAIGDLPTSTVDGVAWGERRQRIDDLLAAATYALTRAKRQIEKPEA